MEPGLGPALHTLISFTLACALIEFTPGPNMTYLAIVSASAGRRAGFATVAGVATGLAILGVIAAVGVAELIQASPAVYETLRWAGVIFLLYLAWEGWTEGGDVASARAGAGGRFFRRGLLTNLLNPKAAVFYVTVLPTFIEGGRSPLTQSLTLTAIYVAIATAVHGAIVLLAGALQPMLANPVRERLVRRVLSVLLALVALWFAWSTGQG